MSCCACYVGDPRDFCGCECCYQELTIPEVLGSSLYQWHQATHTTVNGSGLFRWTDLSGNGRESDSPVAGEQPVVAVTPLLGTVVRSDGVNDRVVSVAPAADYTFFHNATVPAYVWIVFQPPVAATSFRVLFSTTPSGGIQGVKSQFNAGPSWRYFVSNAATTADAIASVPSETQPTMQRVTLLPSGSVENFLVQPTGTVVATASRGAPSALPPPYPLSIFNDAAAAAALRVDVAEVVVARNATATQAEKVTALLRYKYRGAGLW